MAATGTKTYIVRYHPRGGGAGAPKRYVVIGRHGPLTPDEARARAKALLGQVAAGRDPAQEQKTAAVRAMTVATLVELFLDQHVKAKRKSRTAAGYGAVLHSYLVPRLGRRAADGITSGEIAQLHLSLRTRPYQANTLLAVIGSMYGFAARRGLVPRGTNPAAGVERFRETSRERYLTTEELGRLGESLALSETHGLPWAERGRPTSKHLAKEENRRTLLWSETTLAFRLLLFTGARLREILHLEWRFIDLQRGQLL